MLRRGAGDCYSRSRAICRKLRHIVQFARMPNETLRSCGFSAEYLPHLHGVAPHRDSAACHPAAAEKPDAAARGSCGEWRCPHLVAASAQRCRNEFKWARMTCKSLSLTEIRAKRVISCLG